MKPDGKKPEEQPAVRTTIVGGRPPGSGRKIGAVPRGIEVLTKKASVDAAFRKLLLAQRSKAADVIGLTLEPAEAMMLDGVPAAQLEAIISATKVHPRNRAVFMGGAAVLMLAALGVCALPMLARSRGIEPDRPNAGDIAPPASQENDADGQTPEALADEPVDAVEVAPVQVAGLMSDKPQPKAPVPVEPIEPTPPVTVLGVRPMPAEPKDEAPKPMIPVAGIQPFKAPPPEQLQAPDDEIKPIRGTRPTRPEPKKDEQE